ncbi:BTAD domain-containing putative transcriptional regulator [Actinocrispum sp. NPDC049592]|uniref:AfsR/SARP family transcriptional regulator n=1 Tax=Actinocrispum sp. NPDC049592 TaxID=3154835 RepID=UPI003441D036
MRFALLGPVRAWRAGAELELGPPQQRLLLAVLLAGAGGPISLDELVDMLWEDNPPASAVNVIHRYVGALRRVFEPELAARATGSWLIRDGATYRLAVTPDSADLLEFRELAARARQHDAAGQSVDAVALFTQALRLWRGPCAHGIMASGRARTIFTKIDQECLTLVCEAADVALENGLGADVLQFLRQASSMDPFNEAIQSRLVLTLAATGNQAAALKTYETVRERLAEELGIDPGPELAAAFQRVLTPHEPAESRPQVVEPLVRPAQLPPDLPAFAGRRTELKYLQSLLPSADEPPRGLTTIALDGMPGAGKTTLAVHWAHTVADRFPDGQLYVNMRGFDPNGVALSAAEALRGFLDALGMPPERIPAGLDAQTGLYRSLLSQRRVLVLIDNVRDLEHVRPLLPGAAGCHVIVTSRNRLTGLVASEGAFLLTLDTLSIEDARETVLRRLGPERVSVEAEAVEELIELCGRLPLALAIVSARAAANPHFPLSAIIQKLKRGGGTLAGFRDGDAPDVRTVFSWSYRILSPDAARLFRLLSLHSGPATSLGGAASLIGLSQCETSDLLDELTRTRFLTEVSPGRFVAHDLIRTYAIELRNQYDSEADQHEALGRLLDYYLHTSHAATVILRPTQMPEPPMEARPGVVPETITSREDAMEWFAEERHVIGDLVKNSFPPYCWTLAITMQQFYQRRGLLHDWAATMSVGLAAATNARDDAGRAIMHRSLAGAMHYLGRSEDALEHLRRAEMLFNQLGWTTEHAFLDSNFGTVLARQGKHIEAIERHRHALTTYQEVGDRKGQAIALQSIGSSLAQLGNHDEALPIIRDAMAIYQAENDRGGEGDCWSTLGEIHHRLGDVEQATNCYKLAGEIYRELGNRSDEVEALILLGDILHETGSAAAADTAWRQALVIIEELRLPGADEVRAKIAG